MSRPDNNTIIKEAPDGWKNLTKEVKKLIRITKRCEEGIYLSRDCMDCKHNLMTFRQNCKNRYCSDADCIEARRERAWHKLLSYKIKSKRVRHVVIGFEIKFGEGKQQKNQRAYLLRKIKAAYKREGIKVYALIVEDMKVKAGSKPAARFYMHLHLAMLPPKDERHFKLATRKVQDSVLGSATIIDLGWRSKKSLFQYFAKIIAGLFSTDQKHHTATLNEILNPNQYVHFFKNRKLLRVWNVCLRISPPERSDGNLETLGSSQCGVCPKCGSENIKVTYVTKEEIDPGGGDPSQPKKLFILRKQFSPNSYQETVIEIGSIKPPTEKLEPISSE